MKKPDEDSSLLEIFNIPPAVMEAFDGVKSFFPPPKHWETRTRPYYNGRERGICISFHLWESFDVDDLYVVIAKHRVDDSIISYHWVAKRVINIITAELVPDEAFSSKFHLGIPSHSTFEKGVCRIGDNIRNHIVDVSRIVEVAGVINQ